MRQSTWLRLKPFLHVESNRLGQQNYNCEGEFIRSFIELAQRSGIPGEVGARSLSMEEILDLDFIALFEQVRVAPGNRSTASGLLRDRQRDAFIKRPSVQGDLALERTAAHGNPRQINLGLRQYFQRIMMRLTPEWRLVNA